MRKIKDLSEIPYGILKKLYALRLRRDWTVPFEKYVDNYRFISVKEETTGDETAYAAGDETWRKWRWLEGYHITALTIPDAVIYNGFVIKNRYGYQSPAEFLEKERMDIIGKTSQENAAH